MLHNLLKSKLHRVRVTDANVDYEGSITLAKDLMAAACLIEYEQVHIWDVTNGNRLRTYVMTPAPAGSGTCCINGAAARLIHTGDIVIVTSFGLFTDAEVKTHRPIKVFVGGANKIKKIL